MQEVPQKMLELFPVGSTDVTYCTVVHQIPQRFFVLAEVPRSYASNCRSLSIAYRGSSDLAIRATLMPRLCARAPF